MAAAYAYHLAKNHPCVDGNKRAALAAALVFLELNGNILSDPKDRLYKAIIGTASGKVSKLQLAELFSALASGK